ncbi:sigma factor-like helix-turn-helix DNA-binding protein [Streptomyces sp. NPDC057654]|uniref:sigma factor-like helix-turn-helix DNA-binding protein n=1 Tax=Streptomyces sp. NPDC057654 TaxID=3346196 RepID=UPI003698D054
MVYEALAALPPRQRATLAWHLDGFTTSEIGRALSMTHEAVRQNLSRARARARARLKTTLLNATDGGGRCPTSTATPRSMPCSRKRTTPY